MGANFSRRQARRRRYRLPRWARLAIFLGSIILMVLLIVLIARGFKKRSDTPVTPPTVLSESTLDDATEKPHTEMDFDSVSPASAEPSPEPGIPEEIPNEAVDVEADLAATKYVTVPTGKNRVAVIRSIGDIVVDKHILNAAKTTDGYDFSPFLAPVKKSMESADYTVLNVDGPMGGKKYARYKRYQGYPQFNTPPDLMINLKDCGVDMLTLANNHALDTYFDGLKAEIENCEKVGLAHIGAFRSKAERNQTTIVEINGIRVGFLNYTVSTNNMDKRSDKAASEYGLAITSKSNAPQDIKKLRDDGAEVVLVYMHWGEEYKRTPEKSTRAMAKKLVAAGADAVIGGHPHFVQGAEWLTTTGEDGSQRRGLVLYSMGNFFTEHKIRHADSYADSGIIFEFTLQENAQTGEIEVASPRYVPVYVWQNSSLSDFRVVLCAETIQNRPQEMSNDVYNRVKQVWNELKETFANGVVEVAAS